MKKITLSLSLLSLVIGFENCKKEDDPIVYNYTVPTTYNFVNVNYSNQTKLIAMADQLVVAINAANTVPGTAISAQKLKDMFYNTGNYFNDSALSLNGSGLRLADFCAPAAKTDMMRYFDSIGFYSQSTVTAAPGVPGTIASTVTPSKKLLLSGTAIFYSQVVKKTIMGGIAGYEIANVRMSELGGNTLDNNTVIAGEGTAMEHRWDEAFGFFGVPVTFPTTTTGSKYYGSYSNQVDPGLHSNATLMNAFLKGRAAITGKDMATKNEQVTIIVNTFDKLAAACIVQEMKETDVNIKANDMVSAYSTMSETIGFINALKYNTSARRIITNAQITQLEALLDSSNPSNPNFYNFFAPGLTTTEMLAKTDAIRQMIGNIYGFSAADLALL